ncbi:MAG TPA: hypothetical protein VNF99_22330 [Stellaceae bacterium]|nr:hypothetical protein [Stellaceae bacterium]
MNDQRRDQHQPPDQRDKQAASTGGQDRPQQADAKPKTEQASHQGGGGVRSDHKPQGPGMQK